MICIVISIVPEVFERFVYDPSLIDLVLWYPYLSWQELAASTLTVLAWRAVSERAERIVAFYVRRFLSRTLFRLAVLVKPRVA